MSRRVEQYSIDEVFLGLEGFTNRDLTDYDRRIVRKSRQLTGIPVSVAIAPTKTLAKVVMEGARPVRELNE